MKIMTLMLVASLCCCCSNDEASSGDSGVDGGSPPELAESETAWKDLKVEDGKIKLSDEEWKKRLTPEQFYVCREQGTERRGTGAYTHTKKDGTYLCVACGQELFESKTKYDSGSGWPAFWAPSRDDAVSEHVDRSLPYETRVEVKCSRCDSHLGHVFTDGPEPTGLRYCINSVSLLLREAEEPEKK